MISSTTASTIPNSIPALLAEEYLIDPKSMLPSFLEILFMDDVHRSIEKAIQLIYHTMLEKLSRVAQTTTSTTTGTSWSWKDYGCKIVRICHIVATKFAYELQSLFRFGMERQCLQWYDATIAETIYRMRRGMVVVPPTTTTTTTSDNPSSSSSRPLLLPLNQGHRNKLAFLLALIPYLQKRFQQKSKHEPFTRTAATTARELSSQCSFIRQLFRHNTIPVFLLTVWNACDLYYHWKYLLGLTNYTHVTNRILGHIVRRITQQDLPHPISSPIQNNSTSTTQIQPLPSQQPQHQTMTTLFPYYSHLTTAASIATLVMISMSWGTQLRAWYEERVRQSLQDNTTGENGAMMIVPPPPSEKVGRGCGICGRTFRIHPTTCRPTGLVFCKSCIHKHVRNHQQCPVTGISLAETDLLGLYEPTEAG